MEESGGAYINESTKAENSEQGVDVTLASEVQASSHMAAWTADPMWVSVKSKRLKTLHKLDR